MNRSMLDVSRWLLKSVRPISSRGICVRSCLRAGSRLGSDRADSDVKIMIKKIENRIFHVLNCVVKFFTDFNIADDTDDSVCIEEKI